MTAGRTNHTAFAAPTPMTGAEPAEPHLMQDLSRELTAALASKPDAMLRAREAARSIADAKTLALLRWSEHLFSGFEPRWPDHELYTSALRDLRQAIHRLESR